MSEPLLPSRGDRSFRDSQARRVMFDRLEALCERLEFGVIQIEIANCAPKDVRIIHQALRLDLTDPKDRDIIKPSNDSSHDGGSTKS